MQTEEFINRVEQSEDVGDRTIATNVTFATIEVLSMHLPAEERRQMISQLPSELSQSALKGGQQAGDPQDKVELEQFYNEVATRADMSTGDVQAPVRAVINVFKKALTDGEFVDVTFDLPPDINTLLAS